METKLEIKRYFGFFFLMDYDIYHNQTYRKLVAIFWKSH